jgi:hypothetical protein
MALDDALSGLGGFYGSLVGDWITQDEREARRKALEEERALYEGLPTALTPEEERLVELGPSAYESLGMDPRGGLAQMEALRWMQEIASAGGMDPQHRAALARSQAANAQQERAARGAILDTFARRGAGRGGNAMLAALANEQGAAQRAGMEGIQAAGNAAARQYQALADSGSLAGAIRGADYQQAGDRAGALDRVSQYNAANRQAVNARNTGTRNQFTQGNADLAYRRAGMLGGTYGTQRDMLSEEERRKRGLATGIGGAFGRNVGTGMDLYGGGG